jgi:hypothetical protein
MSATDGTPDRTISPLSYSLGEGIDRDGNLLLVLAFEHDDGTNVGYSLGPITAAEIVNAITEWADQYAQRDETT